jgi:hypothetical protein
VSSLTGTHHPLRVILATIRDKGLCPCPRCLIPKPKLDRVGHLADAKARTNQARSYQSVRGLVEMARNAIYDQGVPINGARVQRLLKPTSSVPTLVSLGLFIQVLLLTISSVPIRFRMRLLRNLVASSIYRECSSSTSCTRSSSGCGRPFSPISFAFSMPRLPAENWWGF